MNEQFAVADIHNALRTLGGYNAIYIPEFTWHDLRIDAAIVDLKTRWVRGFEVKVNRADFKSDDKFIFYTNFCSSLSIVCPHGLIEKEEVGKPFGLLWIGGSKKFPEFHWQKKPQRFQSRTGLAWFWTYLKVIERELPRLEFENQKLRAELAYEKSKPTQAGRE